MTFPFLKYNHISLTCIYKTAFMVLFVFYSVGCWARKPAEIPNVHRSDKSQYVSNPDGVLSSSAVSELNKAIGGIWDKTSAEIVVVAVDNLDGMDINSYATTLFELWGIGKEDKDNGLLILLSKDDKRVVLRPGYGLEGLLPDAICYRIISDQILPYARQGNYDAGLSLAIGKIADILGTPEAVEEIKSKYANDSLRKRTDEDNDDLWSLLYLFILLGFLSGGLLYFVPVIKTRKLQPTLRYNRLQKIKIPLLMVSCIGLGFPLVFYWMMSRKLNKVRNGKRACPNCGEKMHKLDEISDNAYLTPTQDTEEQLQSVDYDVWVCPSCNETDIIPFDNPNSPYTVCPTCGAKACSVIEDRTVIHPTTRNNGKGVRIYACKHCGGTHNRFYDIPAKPQAVVPPVIFFPGGGLGGGGGMSGGSFGGGRTGGGGATGSW